MRSKATIYPIVPEVCCSCSAGLAWMSCFDGKFRCRTCVHAYAKEMGWDKVPASFLATPKSTVPVTPPETPRLEEKIYRQPEMF